MSFNNLGIKAQRNEQCRCWFHRDTITLKQRSARFQFRYHGYTDARRLVRSRQVHSTELSLLWKQIYGAVASFETSTRSCRFSCNVYAELSHFVKHVHISVACLETSTRCCRFFRCREDQCAASETTESRQSSD